MQTPHIELSSEQQNALQQLAQQSGDDVPTIISRAVDYYLKDQNWIQEMRQAYLDGVASGDGGILDIEHLITEANEDWRRTHPK